MYSVKGSSWAGQTFALASVSDSSGSRKSRIRRSKEERKTLVESFIKRYQSLNNGKFPSLNLTHKEVGGSFYTVREIVREIIQENRVLGPGQFSSEEQKDDAIAMNYPLGTISSEPHAHLLETVNELNGFSTQEGKETVDLSLDANGKYTEHVDLDVVQYPIEHQANVISKEDAYELLSESKNENLSSSKQERESFELDALPRTNGKCFGADDTNVDHVMNHIDTNDLSKNYNMPSVEGLRESKTGEVDGESDQMSAFQAKLTLPTEEVEVETFPLRPAVKESGNSGRASSDSKKFDVNSYNSEVKVVTVSNSTPDVDKVGSFDASSDLLTSKVAGSSEVLGFGGRFDMIMKDAEINPLVVQNKEVNQENSLFNDDIPVLHNQMSHVSVHGDLISATDEQNNLQTRNASIGTTYVENSDGSSCKNSKDPTVVNGIAFKRDEKATVGSSPLNRIDLESWRASKQETNPLLAFFKAFIDAFARFWSE